MYPPHDDDYQEVTIDHVEPSGKSWVVGHNGWMLYCGDDCTTEPKIGQTARMYPRADGGQIRGLFIDGARIWYRTDAGDKEYGEIKMCGADAADWLKRWDAGEGVWSIEMGGIGPGYEQCIHITAAEILRWFLANNADVSLWGDKEVARPIFDRMEKTVSEEPAVKVLGLSGAQWGAARNLACHLYRRGPRDVMNDEEVKHRRIQVSRNFPSAPPIVE